MKGNSLIVLLLALTIFSCKKDDSTEPISSEEALLAEIELLPEITASEIEQNAVSKMDVLLTVDNAEPVKYSLLLNYDNSNRLKNVINDADTLYAYNYSSDQVSIIENGEQNTLFLNNDGLAKEIQGLKNEFKYFFKNNYFVRTTEFNTLKKNYSSEGNLVSYKNKQLTAEYDYTDIPNTIRQEVLSPLTFHWSFRDKYLGNFSTNLLKTAIFHDTALGFDYTLIFSYEFDELNRVSKVIINRQDTMISSVIEYTLSY